jgi:flavin reductase (DIM6/NTAB) family NADH-FMN oxidoreductase RutF
MEFDFRSLAPKLVYNLMVSSVMPRPIALTTSCDAEGHVNAAPFSFFNVGSTHPPLLVLGLEVELDGRPKDTSLNIRATGQFVVNLVDEPLAEAMNLCATSFPRGTNELEVTGLATLPSRVVRPPRIAEAPVSFECETYHTLDLGGGKAVQVGRVVYFHIQDRFLQDADKAYVDGAGMGLIGRMHGKASYARTTDLFELRRMSVEAALTKLGQAGEVRA